MINDYRYLALVQFYGMCYC